MRNQKRNVKKKKVDVRSGIALAITFFAISIFLYFQKDYFGFLTNLISIVCIVIGLIGFGVELNKITSQKLGKIIDTKKGPGIFDNLGIGIGIFVIWVALYRTFSTYGMILGLVNLLFAGIVNRGTTNTNQREDNELWLLAVKISAVISGIIGFIASLIQILQYLKIL